jgi:NTP pyrophosphatase (non-canonical NTP hydrolase)
MDQPASTLLSLGEIQEERDMWVAHNFPADREDDSFYGVVEEMGELSHHLLKRRQGIRTEDHDAEIKDACADLVIFLLGIASHEGFVLHEVIDETWRKVRQRDWVRYPLDGVSE